jgi:hypothetical protein
MSEAKLKKVAETYLEWYETLGPKFDFYKMGKYIERLLEKEGLKLNSPGFFAKILEDLEKASPQIKLSADQIIKMLESLPTAWRKKIPVDVAEKYLPPGGWESLKKAAANVPAIEEVAYDLVQRGLDKLWSEIEPKLSNLDNVVDTILSKMPLPGGVDMDALRGEIFNLLKDGLPEDLMV